MYGWTVGYTLQSLTVFWPGRYIKRFTCNHCPLVEIKNKSHYVCKLTSPLSSRLHPMQKLPVSQACGVILGYEVRLFYKNGTSAVVNGSIAERYGMLCDEVQCHFNSSLKDASSVSVSAYNAHGATVPSYLTLPVPGINFPNFHKSMESYRLKVIVKRMIAGK